MKEKIIQLGQWGQQNWLPLIIILSCVMMLFLVAVMVSWLVGYWANALYGMHFDLSSCWSGVTAVIGGIATVVGLGKACWTKYGYDSRFNSARYAMPAQPPNAPTAANNTEKMKG
jgi:hypothetical protein